MRSILAKPGLRCKCIDADAPSTGRDRDSGSAVRFIITRFAGNMV